MKIWPACEFSTSGPLIALADAVELVISILV